MFRSGMEWTLDVGHICCGQKESNMKTEQNTNNYTQNEFLFKKETSKQKKVETDTSKQQQSQTKKNV